MSEPSYRTDRRVQKTRRAIRNGFAKLLTKKEIDDITVTELSETANINRKTFYNYYSGVHEVAEEIMHELESSYTLMLSFVNFKQDMQNPYHLFENLSRVINMDPEFFGLLLSIDGNRRFATQAVNLIKRKTKEAMLQQMEIDEVAADMILNYALTGLLSVYQSWINSDKRIPLEEVSRVISIMCFDGFNGVVKHLQTSAAAGLQQK